MAWRLGSRTQVAQANRSESSQRQNDKPPWVILDQNIKDAAYREDISFGFGLGLRLDRYGLDLVGYVRRVDK